jgi:hypothetical protein
MNAALLPVRQESQRKGLELRPAEEKKPRVGEEFTDDFSSETRLGKILGSEVREGITRRGVDVENTLGMDNGALRIRPLLKPGWGRSGIAYGPYERRNGLAFAAAILNGHNTSQAGLLPDSLWDRLKRWACGSETEKPLARFLKWLQAPYQKRTTWRLFRQWIRSTGRIFPVAPLDENLAVGWFPAEALNSPLQEGNSLIIHALGPECGELWARVKSTGLAALRGVQNVPLYFLIILRERGAAYYASAIPDVPGLHSYPQFRPIGIDAFAKEEIVYAGVNQSVLGQIGFRSESRVFKVQVADLQNYSAWYGTAMCADQLSGSGPLESTPAEVGGAWDSCEGRFERTVEGVVGCESSNTAIVRLDRPAGLVHVLVKVSEIPVSGVEVLWRVQDKENFWGFKVSSTHCELIRCEAGVLLKMPATERIALVPNAVNSIQVTDDGRRVRLFVNGEHAYGGDLTDTTLADACGAGIRTVGATVILRDFEVHPRSIDEPREIKLGTKTVRKGGRPIVGDAFAGVPVDLDGHAPNLGETTWHKDLGVGSIYLTGNGAAQVAATPSNPCPGRVIYTVPWNRSDFTDLQVEITSPGTARGQGERGRGGLVLWQDSRTYITLSAFVDDWYGSSIAAFFHVKGFEELYDAVWTNLGKRIYWGVPYKFRVVFDRGVFVAYVNDEPVLYRSLTDIYPAWHDFKLNRVGIVSNWEWGTDTGTVFRDFVGKDLP